MDPSTPREAFDTDCPDMVKGSRGGWQHSRVSAGFQYCIIHLPSVESVGQRADSSIADTAKCATGGVKMRACRIEFIKQ